MKTKIDLKHTRAAYLYDNGLFLTLNETRINKVSVEWFDVYERPFNAYLDFKGCLVFTGVYRHNAGEVGLLKHAIRVESRKPFLDGGSEATKERGIQVGYTTIKGKDFGVCIYEIPGLLSSNVCLKDDSRIPTFESMVQSARFAGVQIRNRIATEKQNKEVEQK